MRRTSQPCAGTLLSSCLRLVHQLCQQFLAGPGVDTSTLLCWFCCDEASTTALPSISTAQASSAAGFYDSTALPINQSTVFPPKERA
jgi:hypothetical protein